MPEGPRPKPKKPSLGHTNKCQYMSVILIYNYNYNSPLAGTGAFLQVLDPGVALLCVGEVLLPLALEQLPPGHLGAPGVSHPHPPPAVGAAGRPVRPLKQHTGGNIL